MTEKADAVVREALALTPADRVRLVDLVLASLDRTDPHLDAAWQREAEDRLAAYDRGELQADDAEDVLARYRRR